MGRSRSWKTERDDLRGLLRGPVITALRVAMDPASPFELRRDLAAEVAESIRRELRRPAEEAIWRRRRARKEKRHGA